MGAEQSQLNSQTVNLLCKETGMSRLEITDLYGTFNKIRCSNGATKRLLLTVKDFKKVYSTVYGEEGEAFAEQVFRVMDNKQKGSINFSTVIQMLSSLKEDENFVEKSQWIFNLCDCDGDGEISWDDAIQIITALYDLQSGFIPHENSTPPETLTHILFRNVQSGSSGRISKASFAKVSAYSNMLQQFVEGAAKAVMKPLILTSQMRNRRQRAPYRR